MFLRKLVSYSVSALIGASLLAAPIQSASAFTLAAPSIAPAATSTGIDKVFWRHGGGWGGGWHGGGWRGGWWGPGIVGGLAAGAILGSGYYGYGGYGYDPCWRRVYDPYYGWRWRPIC